MSARRGRSETPENHLGEESLRKTARIVAGGVLLAVFIVACQFALAFLEFSVTRPYDTWPNHIRGVLVFYQILVYLPASLFAGWILARVFRISRWTEAALYGATGVAFASTQLAFESRGYIEGAALDYVLLACLFLVGVPVAAALHGGKLFVERA